MTARRTLSSTVLSGMLWAATAAGMGVVGLTAAPAAAQQSEIRVVVNQDAITSYQVQQRAAFLRLRREDASNEAALNELIDESVKNQEIRRRGISVPDSMVDEAFANFAQQNRMTVPQLDQVLGQAGFSQSGFKDYIRTQMGWARAVQDNVRQAETLSEEDVVQRMLQQGGQKPSTTEYTLQQVVFVVPEAERASAMGRRMQEANSFRQRFSSCPATYQFAQGLRDVTVRELGRVAQPELPPEWREEISAISGSGITRAQETARGVEFIAVCDQRVISDDRAATMVFQARELEAMGQGEPDVAFLTELRERASIIRR